MKLLEKQTGECFCNRDFEAEQLKAIVKRIRDNTFYDGKSITEFHQEKIFYGHGGVPKPDQNFEKFTQKIILMWYLYFKNKM